jgi:hypothetical protein
MAGFQQKSAGIFAEPNAKGTAGAVPFVHRDIWSLRPRCFKRRERRSGKAETGEEAEFAAANEHSEPVSNAA